LNFIFGIVCLFVCVCAFSLRRESPDMILGDKTPHFWGGSVTIVVLYVDGILFASSDKNLLYETKGFLSSDFDMKYLGDASYVLGIEIHWDRTKGGISQKSYIEKVLKRYNMNECSITPVPFMKGDKHGIFQCPRNQLEINEIKLITYASVVKSIMYA
jgi:hypothetical protein